MLTPVQLKQSGKTARDSEFDAVINKLVEEADSVKRDIYEGYVGSGRMFQGYDIEDPKRIIGGLLK